MNRAIFCALSLIILTVLITGCFIDVNSGRRPINYPNTRWVSENPDMYFVVGGNKRSSAENPDPLGDVTYAQIVIDGEVIEVKVSFAISGGLVCVSDLSYYDAERSLMRAGGDYFLGLCRFSPDSLVIYDIRRYRPGFLDDSIEEIVFIRGVNIKEFRKGG